MNLEEEISKKLKEYDLQMQELHAGEAEFYKKSSEIIKSVMKGNIEYSKDSIFNKPENKEMLQVLTRAEKEISLDAKMQTLQYVLSLIKKKQ